MSAKLVNPTSRSLVLATLGLALAVPASASAERPAVVQNPSHVPAPAPVVIDFSHDQPRVTRSPGVRFSELDAHRLDQEPAGPAGEGSLPEGLAQVGGMVVPRAMLDGAAMVPDAASALTGAPGPQHGGPDLSEICAFPDEVPAGVYDYDYRPGMEFPRFHTVYVNFTGEPEGLFTGGENSAENMSNIARSGHPYPVYGGGEERAIAVAQAVAADFADWAVRVVYLERPPKVLPYTMAMVGGHYSDTTAGPSGGVAPLDCEDFGQRNVCYAFQNLAPATSQANVVSQEIGHTLGLGHTSASDSVMAAGYSNTQPGDLGFNETCADTIQVSGQGAACIGVNRCHCGVPDQQHDWQTLSTTFMPAGVDTTAPTITMPQPPDGAVFDPEDTIRVEFEPWDDVGGYGWGLIIEDSEGNQLVDQVDYERALVFDLVGIPPGTYTLTAYIRDHGDNVGTHSVTITIGDGEAMGDSGGLDGTGTGADEGDGTTGDDGEDETSDGDAGLDSEMDDGCGCRNGGPEAPGSMLWGLALLGLWRRGARG